MFKNTWGQHLKHTQYNLTKKTLVVEKNSIDMMKQILHLYDENMGKL